MSRGGMMKCSRFSAARTAVAVVVVISFVCLAACDDGVPSDLEEQMRVLSKQVTTLLDRRREDLKSIEDNMRRKLSKSPELVDVREELQSLRLEIDQLRSGGGGNFHGRVHRVPHSTQEKNDHLTLKWLSAAVSEVRTEISEIQTTLNSTVILQNHEQLDNELSLLRTDVSNLNKELDASRSRNAKYEAEILELREEIGSLKDNWRVTAATCGKIKNQLKATQLEWNFNWKNLVEKNEQLTPLEETSNAAVRPSRHQRLMKKHIIQLEKSTNELHRSSEELQSKVLKLEEEVHILQNVPKLESESVEKFDRINGNEIENLIRANKLTEVKSEGTLEEKVFRLEQQQKVNTNAMFNLSRQLSNFDKLHMSMLELLENVESIENKVDKNFPEFRKEISKLEIQTSEATSKIALIKEDQTNVRVSMKAIGVSVSNLKDRVQMSDSQLKDIKQAVEMLKKSSSVQTSKLHDHILKSESSTIEFNSTKSTIHLVQELKSFEKEYKSIVNKLPYDCSSVQGPSGIYLISPGEGEPIMAYCGDGWTTIQKRYDGSVNFNRNWNDYSNGFGSATGEHWLGNRNLHALTKDNCTKLEINMKDIYGKNWHVNYDDFRVADFALGFKLTVDKYTGNASDALDYQNHMEFSTIDNDRDISNTHCASNYEGGWWFSHCQHANLNGRYNLGLTWFDSSRNEWIAVATSEMRVKRRDRCIVY